jgi:hypothetical protein
MQEERQRLGALPWAPLRSVSSESQASSVAAALTVRSRKAQPLAKRLVARRLVKAASLLC